MNLRRAIFVIALGSVATTASAQTGAKKPGGDANASPSGTGIASTSSTTGTANYPADPNAASPSAKGNVPVAGQQNPEVGATAQASSDAGANTQPNQLPSSPQ